MELLISGEREKAGHRISDGFPGQVYKHNLYKTFNCLNGCLYIINQMIQFFVLFCFILLFFIRKKKRTTKALMSIIINHKSSFAHL